MAMPVTLALPVLSSVSVSAAEKPLSTLPKASEPGVTFRCASTAIPVRETVSGNCVASLDRLSVPVRVPVAVGLKVTVSTHETPAASVDPMAGHIPAATE